MPDSSKLRRRLAETCLELVKIPSVTGDEQAITDHLERWALALPRLGPDDIFRYDNCLVVGTTSDTKPSVALVGHTDTVPPEEDYAGARLTDTHVVGLGASDMKGALAVMQVLFEVLDIEDLPFAPVLVFYDKEEGPYADNGLGPLLEAHETLRDVDLAIAMEPTDNDIHLGCVGSIQAKVTFRGKAAHSGRPWEGENAIHAAGELLSKLADRPYEEVVVEGLTFRQAMTVTLAQGGRARNVVPDKFELTVNHRFAPRGRPEDATADAVAELRRVIGSAEVEIMDIAPPGPVPVDNPVLEHLHTHAHLDVKPKQAWTDVARLAANGIDAINFGPGAPSQAHQAGEHIRIDALVESFDVLSRVLSTPLVDLPEPDPDMLT